MGNIMERTCRNCGKAYKFKSTPSFIAFCSHCKMFDYSKCKYVFPVTECTVFMGDEIIGTVKVYTGDTCVYDGDTIYDISVPDLGITETLKTKYDPLIDAAYVIIDNLSKKYGLMDIRNGKLILLGERLCRGYTFRQFKKSSMYTGQNAEKNITLNNVYRINDKKFYISLFFRHGLLYLISLVCNDISLSPVEESKRKELHDKLLSEYGLSDDEQFMWGSVCSVYDAKANVSSINIEYEYEEDEVPLFYNCDASFSKPIMNEDVKKLIDEDKPYILKDREKPSKGTLREYLTYLIKRTDPNNYNILKINYEAIDTLRKEYQAFLKTLNYPDNRSEEVERLFLFLRENGMTISKLVAKKQGQEYLFSQLRYALELEDTYFNKFLLPYFEYNELPKIKKSEQIIALHDFKRNNSLTGDVVDLNYFMSFFSRQWYRFIEYLYITIEQVCDNICVNVSFPEAVEKEIEYIKSFRDNFYKAKSSEFCCSLINNNPYKNLFVYCLISYLDDFYLSKFPEVDNKTLLNDYYLCEDSDINEGLDLTSYNLNDIPFFSDKAFGDLSHLKNIIPKKKYTLKDVAETYAISLRKDKEKVYKTLEKYFSVNDIFKVSSESGEYEFGDVLLPIATHMYYKNKNRKYDPNNNEMLSDGKIFRYIYFPLFKAKVAGRDDIIDAYAKYRCTIIDEFKNILKNVDDDYLVTSINYVIGKTAMRLNLRIMREKDSLINDI